MHQAKTQLSDLVRRAENGEEVVISRSGSPVARLVAVNVRPAQRLGLDQGTFTVPDDFDEALPADVLDDFA
jgi:antitoxin (DNA-binding transcriptional repressor) of toxin-antitoxin stability system